MFNKKNNSSKSTPSLAPHNQLSIQPAASSTTQLQNLPNSPSSSISSPSSGTNNSIQPFSASLYQQQQQLSDDEVNREFADMLLEMGVPDNIRKKQCLTKTVEEKVR